MQWRLLFVTGKSTTIEAASLASMRHGWAFRDDDGYVLQSIPVDLVLLVERADKPLGLTDEELLAAYDRVHSKPGGG
jgi:hypothetical protein